MGGFDNKEIARAAGKKSKPPKILKRTLLRQKFGVEAVKDLDGDLLEIILDLVHNGTKEDKKFVIKHVLKHVTPIMKESTVDVTEKTIVNFTIVKPSDAGKRD